MRLSTSINIFFDRNKTTVPEAIRRCHEAGYKVVDMNFWDWNYNGSPFCSENWENWIDEIGEAANKYNISFCQSHAPVFNFYNKNDTSDFNFEMCRRALIGSGILNIPWVVFHTSSHDGSFDNAHIREMKENNKYFFLDMLETAEKSKTGIAIENMRDHFGSENIKRVYCSLPDEIIELCGELDHELIGICLDTGHAHIQKLEIPGVIKKFNDKLKVLHVQDNDGITDFHVMPFYGGIKWGALLGALREISYKGDFTYEAHNSIRIFPDELKDKALKFSVDIGEYLIKNYFI